MLTIRAAQVRVLGAAALSRYESHAIGHLRRHFPQQVAALEAQGRLDEVVRHGFLAAARHRLVGNRGRMAYLTLAFMFGRDFDTDPTLPWAAEVLGSGEPSDVRLSRLRSSAGTQPRRAAGYDHSGRGADA